MLPPLADPAHLAAWVGADISPARASTFLEAASALVRRVARQPFVTPTGELDPARDDVVQTITVAVAARMLANPTGVTQQSTGPYSASMPSQYMTDEERATLDGMRTGGTFNGLGTISTTRGTLETAPWGEELDWTDASRLWRPW